MSATGSVFSGEELAVLQSLGLSEAAIGRLTELCEMLGRYPPELRKERLPSQRLEDMRAVFDQASALRDSLMRLQSNDFHDLLHVNDGSLSDVLWHSLMRLIRVSSNRMTDLKGLVRSGPAERQWFQEFVVGCIAHDLKGETVKPSRSVRADGEPFPFLKVCKIVFERIGIYSSPDHAVREFLSGNDSPKRKPDTTSRGAKSKANSPAMKPKKPPSIFPT